MTTPGTYDKDEQPVKKAVAHQAWSAAARPVLLDVAKEYNGTITYKELGETLQEVTGIRTRTLLQNWVSAVLATVAAESKEHDEPVLTSLCVRADGTVSPGYGEAIANRYGHGEPEDPQWHAAEERLRCYTHFGAKLPEDGGHPELTEQVRTERRKAALKNPPKRNVCPTCNLTLPRSGICDTCNDL